MRAPRLPAALLALTPGTLTGAQLEAYQPRLAAMVSAGLAALLVREPAIDDGPLLEWLRILRAEFGQALWIGVHDRPHLAELTDADGCHLGWRSVDLSDARKLLSVERSVGFSAHARDLAEDELADAAASADYCFLSPVRATPNKAVQLEPLGFDLLQRGVERLGVPVWALGGLKPSDAARVRASGARGMAVLSGLEGTDPAERVRRYLEAWDSEEPNGMR